MLLCAADLAKDLDQRPAARQLRESLLSYAASAKFKPKIEVGTNDLLASAMGVSRDDPVSEIVCDPLHPGLLRTVEHVIAAGHRAGKAVTICGELAADEQGAKLLAEMGADALSVAVDQIQRVRATLSAL